MLVATTGRTSWRTSTTATGSPRRAGAPGGRPRRWRRTRRRRRPSARASEGGRGGRQARLRHRQRGLPARDGRDPARLPGPPGSDAARGDPVGDDRRGRADGLGRPGRVARARAGIADLVARGRGSADRHRGPATTRDRHQGRRGRSTDAGRSACERCCDRRSPARAMPSVDEAMPHAVAEPSDHAVRSGLVGRAATSALGCEAGDAGIGGVEACVERRRAAIGSAAGHVGLLRLIR